MQFARPPHDPSKPGQPGRSDPWPVSPPPPLPLHPRRGGRPSHPSPLNRRLASLPLGRRPPAVLAPLGVTAVRATSARQAERIIRSTEVHLAVVDLSTPMEDWSISAGGSQGEPAHYEEAGTRILELLSRLHQAPPTVVLKSPQQSRDEHRQVHHALRCNAFAVVDRTAADLETMLNVMQRIVCRFYKDRWPNHPGVNQPPSPPSNLV